MKGDVIFQSYELPKNEDTKLKKKGERSLKLLIYFFCNYILYFNIY
jgi:hypothetical protein